MKQLHTRLDKIQHMRMGEKCDEFPGGVSIGCGSDADTGGSSSNSGGSNGNFCGGSGGGGGAIGGGAAGSGGNNTVAEQRRLRKLLRRLCLTSINKFLGYLTSGFTLIIYLGQWLRYQKISNLLAGVVASVFISLLCLSRDNVPIDHLDYARAYFDRRDVLYSRWVDRGLPGGGSRDVPTYTGKQKQLLSRWDNNEALISCHAVLDTPLVWTLKTPKAASSTLQDLILGLAKRYPERFVVNTRQLRPHDPKRPDPDGAKRKVRLARYAEYFSSLRRRTVYTAHGWYIDLEAQGRSNNSVSGDARGTIDTPLHSAYSYRHGGDFVAFRPVYIGTMRDPLKRLLSHYNYLHFGPRSVTTLLRHGQQEGVTAPSFAECVRRAHMVPNDAAMETKNAAADLERRYKCLHWAGVQLKYFCGYAEFKSCEAASRAALDIATQNVDRNFLVVSAYKQKPVPCF